MHQVDDLVLHQTDVVVCTGQRGNLMTNWEGPYKVTELVRLGTYRLTTLEWTPIPRTWYDMNLHKYYR